LGEPVRAHSTKQAKYCSSSENPVLHVEHAGTTGRFAGYGSSRRIREGQ
jgi:hypothetical protein